MMIMDVLKKETIQLNLKAASKQEVLGELVDLLVEQGIIRKRDSLLESLLEREGLGSTGIGYGVAIPHGRSSEVSLTAMVFGRTRKDVDFDAIDGKPTRMFFLLVAPENGSNDHLHLLARIARLMKDAPTREKLLELQSPEEVVEFISDRESV